jgi:hypothetical protein
MEKLAYFFYGNSMTFTLLYHHDLMGLDFIGDLNGLFV